MNAYRFGPCVLSVLRRELVVNGGPPVELQPLVFDMLLYFLQHPGTVVTKEALLTSVWHSAVVSESVIASAVMKARRAIHDDARDATILRTVPRVGYRFDAEVQRVEETPAQPLRSGLAAGTTTADLVILRFNITPARSLAEVTSRSLPVLLQHLLNSERRPGLERVILSLSPRRANPAVDELSDACAEGSAQYALACDLILQPSLCRLTARLGQGAGDATEFAVSGASGEDAVISLASLITRHLQGSAAQHPGHAQLYTNPPSGSAQGAASLGAAFPAGNVAVSEGFWEGQFARVVELYESGVPGVAVGLLDRCAPNLKPTVTLAILHARLLRYTGQLERAAEHANVAFALAQETGSPSYQVDALDEIVATAYRQGDFPSALRSADMALQMAVKERNRGVRTSGILMTMANVHRESGETALALNCAERAVASAASLGDKSDEYLSRCVLALCLIAADRTFRAMELATEVAAGAHRLGLIGSELFAFYVLAGVHERHCRLVLALELAKRAHALCVVAGHNHMREMSHAIEYQCMVKIGLVSQALAELRAMDFQSISSSLNAASLRQELANALWRSGHRAEALSLQWELVEFFDQKKTRRWAPQVAELAHNLLCEGNLDRAKDLLALLQPYGPKKVGRLAAAVALAQGQRQQCMDLLRTAWNNMPVDNIESIYLAHDLGWMMLEDGRPEEVETLMSQVTDLTGDLLPSRILATAFAMLWQHQPLDEDKWRQTIGDLPSLLKHAPHWLEPGFLPALRAGSADRLPLLLTRVCW